MRRLDRTITRVKLGGTLVRLRWRQARGLPPPAPFSAMTEATGANWLMVRDGDRAYAGDVAGRLLEHLGQLRDDRHGMAVDRLDHCLQSATRAHRAGRDEEFVVCALTHDVGSSLAPHDHGAFAATILAPYVSERHQWMVRHHDIFQGYYYRHVFGADRHIRDRFRGHPDFEYTAEFCHQFDQSAFDPDYDAMPLSAFEPIVRRVLARRRR